MKAEFYPLLLTVILAILLNLYISFDSSLQLSRRACIYF